MAPIQALERLRFAEVERVGRLQAGEFVEQAAGHDLAREPSRRQCGRGVEGLDHHGAGGEGIVDHNAYADANQGENQGSEHLHAVADALAEPAELALARLVLQVPQAQRALLLTLGGLGVEQ